MFPFYHSKYHFFTYPINSFFFLIIVCSTFEVHLQPHEGEKTDMDKLAVLKMKLEKAGIACGSCKPGQYSRMLCPQVVLSF